jgi:predicted N-acetyltransferase YhbS
LVEIIPLLSVAPSQVEALLDTAFGANRFGRTAYRLRAGVSAIAGLSFAAFADGRLVGTLQSWPVALMTDSGDVHPLIMVGPVAVLPDVQRGGIGRALMNTLLETAERSAPVALMMIGDPEYYGRFFGFTADATAEWRLPGPVERRRLLARAVGGYHPPALEGQIVPRG